MTRASALLSCLLFAGPFACSAGSLDPGAVGASTTSSGAGGGAGGAGGAGLGGSSATGGGPDGACVGTVVKTSPVPLDILFLMDRSASMVGKKWEAGVGALLNFAQQGFEAPTRVGLIYVPFRTPEQPFDEPKTCPYHLYQDLVLPFGELPGHAAALEQTLGNATIPPWNFGISSPLYTAFKGTYFVAAAEQDAHPNHQVVVVHVGDGDPSFCPDYGEVSVDAHAMADLASAALHYNGVRTFAIALTGIGASLLQEMTDAGGGQVFSPTADIEALNKALDSVSRASLGCTFAVPEPPPGQQLDYGLVNVLYTSGMNPPTAVPGVTSYVHCAGHSGWYYDNVSAPTKITLCPITCGKVETDPLAKIDIELGCKTTPPS